MHTDILEIAEPVSNIPSASQLNVVIAYADFDSATIAKRILEQSLVVLAPRYAVKTSFWKFELLNSAALREIAKEDAAEAQIIIISADKECTLPEGAREWVEWCLTRPEVKDVSFVALVRDEEETHQEQPPFLSGFEGFSKRAKTDFFWFIMNDGEKLAADKIIELACHRALAAQVA